MMIVGLTGGIGSGKTTVAKLFKKLGIPVYNSDKEAKKLMRTSAKLRSAIIALLGEGAYTDKKLNRAYIAAKVFKDKELLHQLNQIVHPVVRNHFKRWVKKQTSPYCIQEAAIIFENGSQDNYDHIILITAPEKIRIQRVMERDDSTKEAIVNRMKNQLTDTEKTKLAHFIIENIALKETKKQVKITHGKLLNLVG